MSLVKGSVRMLAGCSQGVEHEVGAVGVGELVVLSKAGAHVA